MALVRVVVVQAAVRLTSVVVRLPVSVVQSVLVRTLQQPVARVVASVLVSVVHSELALAHALASRSIY
jgi:hypothetical protein